VPILPRRYDDEYDAGRLRAVRSQSCEYDSRGLCGSSASQLKTALFAFARWILERGSHGFACAFGFLLEKPLELAR